MSDVDVASTPIDVEAGHVIVLGDGGPMDMNGTSHPFHPNSASGVALDHALGDIEVIGSGRSGGNFKKDLRLDLLLGPEHNEHVVPRGVDAFGSGVVPHFDDSDEVGVGVGTITDFNAGTSIFVSHHMDEMQGEDVTELGIEPFSAISATPRIFL